MKIRIRKEILLFFVCIIFMQPIKAQSLITLDASQVFSTFKFVNDAGVTDKSYTHVNTGAFNLGYIHIHKKGLLYGGSIGLRKAGASMETDGASLQWNLQYAEVRLSAGYMLTKWRLRPYVLASPYYASLLSGIQTINSKEYDIRKSGDVAGSDLGVIGSAGINFQLSDLISLYSCYNFIYGIKNIETTSGQQLFNRGSAVTLGIAFTITRVSPKWIQQ